MDVTTIRALRERALLSPYGRSRGPNSAVWDLFGKYDAETGECLGHVCTQPREILKTGEERQRLECRGADATGVPSLMLRGDGGGPAAILLRVRCKTCAGCRRQRAVVFRHKVKRELAAAPRSWFLTLTFRPEVHWECDREIVKRVRGDLAEGRLYRGRLSAKVDKAVCDLIEDPDLLEGFGADFRPESHEAVFARKVRQRLFDLRRMELMKEVTKFLKRLRERLGAKVRYTLVAEAHSFALAGRPHFHMLLHWADSAPPRALSAAAIDAAWRVELGFIHRRLVKDGESMALYVAKYLSKGECRVTSSKHYGTSPAEDSTLKVESTPWGVGRSHEPVSSRDETTPISTSLPVPTSASPTTQEEGASLLRKYSLAETWEVGLGTAQSGDGSASGAASQRRPSQALVVANERAFRELMRSYGPDLDFNHRLLGRRGKRRFDA